MDRARSALPLILVALLSLGALVPHLTLSSNRAVSATTGVTPPDSSTASTPQPGRMAVTDLLADHFQVDVSDGELKKRLQDALTKLEKRETRAVALPLLRASACSETPPITGVNCAVTGKFPADREVAALRTYTQDLLRSRTPEPSWFDKMDKEPLARAVVHQAAKDVPVEFVIATVPDPVDSYETWQFDPDLDGLRRGIEDSGYTFDRFQFPDIAVEQKPQISLMGQRELHRHWPGVVIFRGQGTAASAPEPLLVLFLVPETPTAGLHPEPFEHAMEFVAAWAADATEDNADVLRGVIGPTFSGSTQSLARAFRGARSSLAHLPCRIRVISGNASNYNNKEIIEHAFDGSETPSCRPTQTAKSLTLTFSATVHPNSAMSLALMTFQHDIGVVGPKASITEGTVFGLNAQGTRPGADDGSIADPDETLRIVVPFNIAQLRNGGPAAQRAAAALDTVLPTVRPLPLQDLLLPTDQLVVRTPETMAAYVELVLRNMIDMLRREGIRAVRITMTDVRDRLFLARELAQRAPDVMTFALDGDLFFSHPEQYPWTSSVTIASSYPLQTLAQLRTKRPGERVSEPRQFPNLGSQGIYNATVALLNYDTAGFPIGNPDETPTLKDYAPTLCAGETGVPPVWMSVAGRQSLSAVSTIEFCATGTDARRLAYAQSKLYMFPAIGQTLLPLNAHDGLHASRATAILLMAVVIGLCFLAATGGSYGWQPLPIVAMEAVLALAAIAFLTVTGGLTGVALVVFSLAVLPVVVVQPWRYSTTWSGRLSLAAAVIIWLPLAWYLATVWRGSFIAPSRLLEIDSGVSPLIPLLLAAALPLIVCAAVLRHRFVRSKRLDKAPVRPRAWEKDTIVLLQQFTLGGVKDLRSALTPIHHNLFHLPRKDWIIIAVSVTTGAAAIFDWPPAPVWSADGPEFGWVVFCAVVITQGLLTLALLQFHGYWRACAELLRRLARHQLACMYVDVAAHLMPTSLFPRRLRLDTLQDVLNEMRAAGRPSPAGEKALSKELSKKNRPRWFISKTWRRYIAPQMRNVTVGLGPWKPSEKQFCKFIATACVIIVRELLSRLTLSLMMIGPCLAILIGLHATVSFQGSHRLLGLIWVDVIAAVVIIMSAFIQMDRDETLSLVTNTEVGEINMNFDLMSKVAVYVLIPMLALFASQFPNLGSGLADLFRSVPNIP